MCVCVAIKNNSKAHSERLDVGGKASSEFQLITVNKLTFGRLPSAFHASHLALLTRSNTPGLGILQGPSVAYKEHGGGEGVNMEEKAFEKVVLET